MTVPDKQDTNVVSTQRSNTLLSYIAVIVWFLVMAWILESFRYEWQLTGDWGEGQRRFGLLFVVFGLAVLPVYGFRKWPLSLGRLKGLEIVLGSLAFVGILWHMHIGFTSVVDTKSSNEIRMDQGQNVYRAVEFLEQGVNPYDPDVFIDPAAYTLLVYDYFKDETCVRFPPGDPLARMAKSWETMDRELAKDLFPQINDNPECDTARRSFRSLGIKYGPVMLLAYYPLAKLTGKPGIFWTNMLLTLVLLAFVFAIALKISDGNSALALMALALLLIPYHLRHQMLYYSTTDLVPLVFVFGGLLSLIHKRSGLAAVLIGLSIGAKLLPGLLFVPLFLAAKRRTWVILLLAVLMSFLPFLIWNAEGIINNILFYNLIRPTDSSAFAHYLAPMQRTILTTSVACLLAYLIVRTHLKNWRLKDALFFLLIAHLGAFGSGTIFHNNYMVWLEPIVGFVMLQAAYGKDKTPLVPVDGAACE